ncbi:MAG: MraY family glycosyltransferase [bacterium]|nr:MraY family glycosyltransferase [bacterium]
MDSLQFVPILVVGFAASLSLTPLSRAIAFRLGVIDKPNPQRKIHVEAKPLMGGLAIFAAFLISLILFSPPQHIVELGAVLTGAGMLALVGLADDRYNLGIGVRLVAQSIAALILIGSGIHIRLFDAALIDYTLTVLWVVGLTNAMNFMDNMDGLAAGLTGIAAIFFTLLAFNEGLTLVSSLAAALAGSAFGFLIYNFNPASTFMGDMGSLVLGFVLAVLGIKLEFGAQPLNVTWMVPILVLGVPLTDTFLVVVTRLVEKRSPLLGGKDHSSHRLLNTGLSQRQTLFILYGLAILFGTFGLAVSLLPPHTALIMGAAGLAGMGIMFGVMMALWQAHKRRTAAPTA